MASQRAEARAHSSPTAVALYWGVVIAWMAVISLLSTEPFSASNTSRYLDPVLRYFFPHITAAQFVFWHYMIRKSAHFAEFFVLGTLAYWASAAAARPGGGCRGCCRRWAWPCSIRWRMRRIKPSFPTALRRSSTVASTHWARLSARSSSTCVTWLLARLAALR